MNNKIKQSFLLTGVILSVVAAYGIMDMHATNNVAFAQNFKDKSFPSNPFPINLGDEVCGETKTISTILTIKDGQICTIPRDATLTITSSGIITNYGYISNSGTIVNDGIIENNGNVVINDGKATFTNNSGGIFDNHGSLDNYDTFNNYGVLDSYNDSINDGTMINYSGGKITLYNGDFENKNHFYNYNDSILILESGGSFSQNSSGIFYNSGTVTINKYAEINNYYGVFINFSIGVVNNYSDGLDTLEDGGIQIHNDSILNNQGTLTNDAGGLIVNYEGGTIANSGTLTNNDTIKQYDDQASCSPPATYAGILPVGNPILHEYCSNMPGMIKPIR